MKHNSESRWLWKSQINYSRPISQFCLDHVVDISSCYLMLGFYEVGQVGPDLNNTWPGNRPKLVCSSSSIQFWFYNRISANWQRPFALFFSASVVRTVGCDGWRSIGVPSDDAPTPKTVSGGSENGVSFLLWSLLLCVNDQNSRTHSKTIRSSTRSSTSARTLFYDSSTTENKQESSVFDWFSATWAQALPLSSSSVSGEAICRNFVFLRDNSMLSPVLCRTGVLVTVNQSLCWAKA